MSHVQTEARDTSALGSLQGLVGGGTVVGGGGGGRRGGSPTNHRGVDIMSSRAARRSAEQL